MLVSTKGRYALRVMIDLAEHPTDGYTPSSSSQSGRASRKNIWKASSSCSSAPDC